MKIKFNDSGRPVSLRDEARELMELELGDELLTDAQIDAINRATSLNSLYDFNDSRGFMAFRLLRAGRREYAEYDLDMSPCRREDLYSD